MDETNAVRRLKRGDMSGLEWLVSQRQVKAMRVAFLITRDPQAAEDIVQDAFLNVYQKIDQFDEKRPFAPWFMRSHVRLCHQKPVLGGVPEGASWKPEGTILEIGGNGP